MKKVNQQKNAKKALTSNHGNQRLQVRSLVLGLSIGFASAASISSIASNTSTNGLSITQTAINSVGSNSTPITNSYTNTVTSNIPTINASPFMPDDNSIEATAAIDAATVGCGDANTQGSIAWTQQEVIKNRQILNTAPVDIDALFNGSGGGAGSGCFSDIAKLVDLSIAIPDFSGMKAAAIAALRQYATRKVCTMVNEATAKALEPLNNAIDIINKNGTIDLNGAVQGAISGGLNKIDPDLANIYKTQAPAGQNVTLFPEGSTTFNTDVKNAQSTVDNAINGIGNPTTPPQTTNTNSGSGTTWTNQSASSSPMQNTPVDNLQAQVQGNQPLPKTEPRDGSKQSIFGSIFN